jgi:phosphate transport system substrate-binding protein
MIETVGQFLVLSQKGEKMRRKLLVLSILVLVTAMLFTACAPDLSVEPEEPEQTEEAAPVEESAEAVGTLQIAGSTTVQPLAESLAEAFMAANADVTIEVQGGGSSVGVTAAGENTVDIGMASRNVKDSEFETFAELQVHTIAFDGIAIVTNPDLELPSLTIEQVQKIFAGEITNYADVGGPDAEIVVVSREEGSGTRAAFEELVMEHNDAEGQITENALLQQSNGQVRTTVAETPNTIAYVSFGFLDESVNTVAIDGVEPTVANVKNGSYSIFRPLNMLTNGDPNELAQAFLDFILSADGQAIVAEEYITVTDDEVMEEEPAEEAALSGTLQIAGSTTVQPLAESLAEAFTAANADVTIEVQGGGSSVGVTAAGENTVDIGMASRNVKDSEFETFAELQVHTIAFDGIAIVTNPDLELPSLTIEQVQQIFAGEITNYADVGGPDAEIVVVSREEGSGTRAAFEELVMEYNDAEAPITETALLQQSNGQVRTTVAETPNTIAYLSFGFLDESVSTVAIDGVEPTVANVKNGSYSIFRPLNMLTNGDPGELAQAFLDFILGADGQAIVAEEYITVTEEEVMEEEIYTAPTDLSGTLQLAGSTTVQPLAESLAEAFSGYNEALTIEVQGGGSSVGVTAAGENTVDIGMASRNVKDSEFETFAELQVHTIAFDGIAIVTNPDLELPSLTLEQVQKIFAGEITNYAEVGGPDAEIVVVSREEGSGTRAAFEELVMEYNDAEAPITETALLQQSNGQVRTTVAETPNTIAYLSFGFLDESVNGVAINDVAPSVENVANGTYEIFRPLNMLTNGDPGDLAQAFLDFILSPEGQAIVAEEYISVK